MYRYNRKIMLLPLAVVFVALLATGVSAAMTFSLSSPVKIPEGGSATVNLTAGVSGNNGSAIFTSAENPNVRVDIVNGLAALSAKTTDWNGVEFITFTAKDSNTNETVPATVMVFVTDTTCDNGILRVDNIDVDDVTGDEDETVPGDHLDVSFDLKTGSDLSDVYAKVWLAKPDGTKVGSKLETEKDDLDDDERSETVDLRVEPTAKSGTHYVFIMAEGDNDGTDVCSLNVYKYKINVERNSHDVLIDKATLSPEAPVCGGRAEITATLYNIGDDSSEDVKLRIRNPEMNIDTYSDLFTLKKSAKTVKMMTFDIPKTAKGNYLFELIAYYNSGSDSKTAAFTVPVTCGTAATTPTTEAAVAAAGTGAISIPTTTASAESGQTVKFTATIKNTEATAQTYDISLSGVTDWATANAEPSSVVLASGAEMPVYIYLTPKASAYGDQTATVSIKSGSTVLATKTLTVSLPQKPATTVTQKISTAATAETPALTTEAIVAIIVIIAFIIGGICYKMYKYRGGGIRVYGEKPARRGRRAAE